MSITTLHLSKENFKFSSAHFLIFDEKSAEMLHGHNYRVKVDVVCDTESAISGKGYLIDFKEIKKVIKDLCDLWDEHILLPEKHPDMIFKICEKKKNYDIKFRDRFYSFPISETIWLPINNTSVENLSYLFAHSLLGKVVAQQLVSITVYIEETTGQSASTQINIKEK